MNRLLGASELIEAHDKSIMAWAALLDSKNERIAALEAALHPFTKHNSSEPTVTITVPSAAVTRARSLLAEGGTS